MQCANDTCDGDALEVISTAQVRCKCMVLMHQ